MYTAEEEKRLAHLYKLYYERDKEFEKAKGKRFWLTVLGFSLAYLIAFFLAGKTVFLPEDATLGELALLLLELVIPSIVVAFIHYFVNATIFGQLFIKSEEEKRILQSIKDEINGKPRQVDPSDEDYIGY